MKRIYLSIDPGTTNIGLTINAITLDNQWQVLHSCSINIKKLTLLMFDEQLIALHGLRTCQVHTCQHVVLKMIQDWQVNSVVSESPYMGKFPQAFSALTECLMAISNAVNDYDPYMSFDRIDPSTIKQSVGVSGRSGDKALMTEAARALVGHYINVDGLDEHAIDSICVGYCWYTQHYTR